MPKGSGGGGNGGRKNGGGGGDGGNPTESGKPASEIPVTMSIGGNTFQVRDELKARGYKYESNGLVKTWQKEMSLSDAGKEVKSLVDKKVIVKKSITPTIREKNKTDGRDVYFYNKKYISPSW